MGGVYEEVVPFQIVPNKALSLSLSLSFLICVLPELLQPLAPGDHHKLKGWGVSLKRCLFSQHPIIAQMRSDRKKKTSSA